MRFFSGVIALALAGFCTAQTAPNFPFNVTTTLGVFYQSANLTITPGSLTPSSNASTVPTIYRPGTAPVNATYMVIMIDTTVTINNTNTTVLQWWQPNLVVGRDSVTLQSSAINASSVVGAPYYPVIPPPGPAHSYTFLLFLQPANFTVPTTFSTFNNPTTVVARLAFNTTSFISSANLSQPVAANYMRAYNSTLSYPNGTSIANTSASTTTVSSATSMTGTASRTAAATFTGGAAKLRGYGKDVMLSLGMGLVGAGLWLI